MTETPHVYAAISAVQLDVCMEGIAKNKKNQSQGYSFRGIDDVYNALSPILAKHQLCILPRILTRTVAEHASKGGGVLFYVTVEAEFDIVAAKDGSKHTIRTFGEAMDSGDKATNKAMSAAYKYACMQAFAIPTEGDNDGDSRTHEPRQKVATVTGEVVKKKPTWTKEEQATGGALRGLFQRIGGDAWVTATTRNMGYDAPSDVIKALQSALDRWNNDQADEAAALVEKIHAADATATLDQQAAKWDWAVPSDVIDNMTALINKL